MYSKTKLSSRLQKIDIHLVPWKKATLLSLKYLNTNYCQSSQSKTKATKNSGKVIKTNDNESSFMLNLNSTL